jgi:hypothetical protein
MSKEKKTCFVIMPFGKKETPEHQRNWKIYDTMIKPVAEKFGYLTVRADELEYFGSITRDIIDYLYESDLVIADLSGRNANVYYELGVRHSLFKCGTIPIIHEGEQLPFDIADYRAVFYTIDLDGPEKFRRELEKRIQAFEKINRTRPDNPVHQILGDKLFDQNRIDSLTRELENLQQEKQTIQTKLNELTTANIEQHSSLKKLTAEKQRMAESIRSLLENISGLEEQLAQPRRRTDSDIRELENLRKEKRDIQTKFFELTAANAEQYGSFEKLTAEKQRMEETIRSLEEKISGLEEEPALSKNQSRSGAVLPFLIPIYRSNALEMSDEDVLQTLKMHGFYDSRKNKRSAGVPHSYQEQTIGKDKVVVDAVTGLIWQQGGSKKHMTQENADKWIKSLNKKGYAGHKDWRLPTLEEAMSLMGPEKQNEKLYIDSIFDETQNQIWTSDKVKDEPWAWVVFFSDGYCGSFYDFDFFSYARAVRRPQSSVSDGKVNKAKRLSLRKILISSIAVIGLGGAYWLADLYPIRPMHTFRSIPQELIDGEVVSIMQSNNFFDSEWNNGGIGFANDFEFQTNNEEKQVFDRTSNLMWQQGGSLKSMTKAEADEWIKSLNTEGYAGFKYWRLPTLEEAMSLIERKKYRDLYIDPIFDQTQCWIWTSDKVKGEQWAWIVNFDSGCCTNSDYQLGKNYVRAVHTVPFSAE